MEPNQHRQANSLKPLAAPGHSAAWLMCMSCALILTQTRSAQLSFDVVSVKPAPSGSIYQLIQSGRSHIRIDNARVDLGCISLSSLLHLAFDVPEERVAGPSWLPDTRFDIQAKLPDGTTKADVPLMLQALLADRFKLAFHKETKSGPGYALVTGGGHLRLKASSPLPADDAGCKGAPTGRHVCKQVTMHDLAFMLTQMARMNAGMPAGMGGAWNIDRPVVDETGLAGKYDFEIEYGPNPDRGSASPVLSVGEGLAALGLGLRNTKIEFPVIVVDHIERSPEAN